MRNIIIGSLVAIIFAGVIGATYYFNKNSEALVNQGLEDKGVVINDLPKSDDEKPAVDKKDDLIKVTNPEANATLSSGMILKGQARGDWFFEASFPIQLVDDQGNEVTTTIATAQSDWMTEDFVDFSATLNFTPGPNKPGKLIFKKDNPSGEAVNDNQLVVPVIY